MTTQFSRRTTATAISRERRPNTLWGLLTEHPMAKVFALLMGYFLFVLIDRELRVPIFNDEVQLVRDPTGSRNEVAITVPSGYVVDQFQPERMQLVIKGLRKDQEKITFPLEASIPEARLRGIGPATPVAQVSLEKNDLKLPGLDRPEPEFREVTVRVTLVVVKELRLELQKPQNDLGYDLDVVFTPPTIMVRGPADQLEALTSIPIEVKAPEPGDDGLGSTTIPIGGLPESYRAKKIRPAEEPLKISATVKRRPRDEDTLDVTLPIRVYTSINPGYDFSFEAPYEDERYRAVTLTGPRAKIEAFRSNPRELETGLRVIADVDKAIETEKERIAEDPNPKGHRLGVPVRVSERDLQQARFAGLRATIPVDKIPMWIKKR